MGKDVLRSREPLAAPGWTRDQNGDVHVDPCVLLRAARVRCTPQMYALFTLLVLGITQAFVPTAVIILE